MMFTRGFGSFSTFCSVITSYSIHYTKLYERPRAGAQGTYAVARRNSGEQLLLNWFERSLALWHRHAAAERQRSGVARNNPAAAEKIAIIRSLRPAAGKAVWKQTSKQSRTIPPCSNNPM